MAEVMRSTGPQGDPDEENSSEGSNGHSAGRSRRANRKRSPQKGSFWRELPILIVTALVLTFLIQTFLARVYVIPSQSMEDTLHGCSGCNNDRVLVDKVSYRFSDPKPGDVVVFRGPDTWGQNEFKSQQSTNPVARFFQWSASLVGLAQPSEKDFVKRVIATGGQTVSCCDERNRVLVDGQPLNESYVYYEPGDDSHQQRDFAPVTVPQGHLWVMGDNRNDSMDSRVQGGGGVNGAVPTNNVIGKAQFIVLPPTRWQSVGDPDPHARALGAPAWQTGIPAGIGFTAAFPVVWIGRRTGARIRDWYTAER